MKTAASTLALMIAALPATGQEWFQHEYGELRAYHRDWLAVCADKGEGQCRVVQTFKDPASDAFFDGRLSLVREAAGGWTVVVMDRGLDNTLVQELGASVDGAPVALPPGSWTARRGPEDNTVDELFVTDPAVVAALIAAMQPGSRVSFRYAPEGEGDGMAEFSLRGITAAMTAVEARVTARQ